MIFLGWRCVSDGGGCEAYSLREGSFREPSEGPTGSTKLNSG